MDLDIIKNVDKSNSLPIWACRKNRSTLNKNTSQAFDFVTLVPNSCEGFPAAEEKAFRAAIEHRREKAFPPATGRRRELYF